MSLSCYHGEEGSTPEGRDAQFKTEEQEQNRDVFLVFFMHKLTHRPKRRGCPPEWFIKFLQCTQSTHSSNSPLTSPVISWSLLPFPRAHTERLKQWARQQIPTRGETRRAISDDRFRKSCSGTASAERLNRLWYRWLYGKSADRSDLRPGSEIRRVSWARLCDPFFFKNPIKCLLTFLVSTWKGTKLTVRVLGVTTVTPSK